MAGQWDVEGKTFLITGGASGLGALYAEAFLKEGAKKVAILDVAEKSGLELADRLNSIHPDRVTFVKCDVSSENDVTAGFNEVVAQFGQLDVIINNAGIMNDSPKAWRKACEVNWQGLVSFTMKGIKHMRKDEGGVGGTIINVSSTVALVKFRYLPIYSGSKMAVLHFSHSIAMEPFFEQTGVRVLTVCFGPTVTTLLQGVKERAYDEVAGEELDILDKVNAHTYQRPESAVTACVTVFREGVNGSTWLSTLDKPAADITPVIQQAFTDFEKILMPL